MSSPNSIFRSYFLTQNVAIPAHPALPADETEKENKPSYDTIGGILSDTKYVWNANGSLFTVYNSKTGAKIAAWNFGSVIKSSMAVVSCVVEFGRSSEKLPFLIVGLHCNGQGQICVFNIFGSRVLRCIEINERVTSLCVVETEYSASCLRMFDGAVAVGTACGKVYILDINRLSCEEVLLQSDVNVRDEINPCKIEIVLSEDDLLQRDFHNELHPAILLNAEENEEDFVLRGPKGDVRIYANKEEVEISALHFCPQLGSLLVGFNFGAWQLWDVLNMQLVYTSPVYGENIPVSHFGVQEPCDDPRAFCYVWAVYSNTERDQPGYSLAVLYSLNYQNKEFTQGYGTLYKNLTSCSVRFQLDVTNCQNESEKVSTPIRAQCVKLQTINKVITRNTFGDNQDETVTICSVIWNVWNSTSPRKCKTYLNLFDLNQWYKEQMPGAPNSKEFGTYLNQVCLSDIMQGNSKLPLLDVQINPDSLSQFMGCQRLEEHYFPTSLAFQMIVLGETSMSTIDNQGHQRALMARLESLGPSVLLQPSESFSLSINLGLTPLFMDTPNKSSTNVDYQRELLLSLALEQKLLGWLCKCVSTWSSGVYETSGCSLNFLLSWGWKRAQVLKENADKLSVILFDYSGLRLDANTHNLLSHCSRQLKDISTIFKCIVKKYLGFVLSPDVVKDQCESLEMTSTHLEVIDWFLNIGLLPECSESNYPRSDELGRIYAPYPISTLNNYYASRRNELNSLSIKQMSSKDSLLFIDKLLEVEFGGHLQKQWDAVSECTGYPPQSLQALMRTYLVENVPLMHKHCVIAYLLLDISGALDQEQYGSVITHLLKFAAVFQLSPSLAKIIQAMWQIDHGDFEGAIEQLLDPIISTKDLKLWHHRVVLKAFLAHQQYNLAFSYLQVRQPAITEVKDLCTILSLYVANNMIDEAFHFQRENQNLDFASALLHHFFKECDKAGQLKSVLFFPLTKEEEDMFIKYLNEVNHPNSDELQIYYYTQHSQYVNALRIYDKTGRIKAGSRGLDGQYTLSDTDNVINKLNHVSNSLSKTIIDKLKRKDGNVLKATVSRPFSVFVHNSEEQIKYKSSAIEAALVKTRETWTQPFFNKNLTKSIIHDDIPFLSTPRATFPSPRILTPLIYSKITFTDDDNGPSPPKRFRPSSRLTMSKSENSHDLEVTCKKLSVRLNTPIVRRKRTVDRKVSQNTFAETPQSILKSQIHKLPQTSEDNKTTSHDSINNTFNSSSNIHHTTSSISKTNAGLTPRRPLPTACKQAVRFSLSNATPESSTTSSDPDFEVLEETALVHSPLDGNEENKSVLLEASETSCLNDTQKSELEQENLEEPPRTPKARRSYRSSIQPSDVSPRSSPRLQKMRQSTEKDNEISIAEPEFESSVKGNNTLDSPRAVRSRKSYRDMSQGDVESQPSISKQPLSSTRPKLQSRKSLTRQVLENNTFNRMVETHRILQFTESTLTSSSSSFESNSESPEVENSIDTSCVISEDPEDTQLDINETNLNDTSRHVTVDDCNEEEVTEQIIQSTPIIDEDSNKKMDTVDEAFVAEEDTAKPSEIIDIENADNYDPSEVSSMDVTKEITGKNSSDDADKVDVNMYDLSEDDDYEAADPKLSVFDVSNDLTLNEAICMVEENILEIETTSNYISDSVEVFGDKSDVLITLEENVSECTMSNEKNLHDIAILETKTESEVSDEESSASSDVEIIELSSGENTLDEGSSGEESYTSSENESNVNPSDSSEESTSINSSVSINDEVVAGETQSPEESTKVESTIVKELEAIHSKDENADVSKLKSGEECLSNELDGELDTLVHVGNAHVVDESIKSSTDTENKSNALEQFASTTPSLDKSYDNVIDEDLFDDRTPTRDPVKDESNLLFVTSTPSGSTYDANVSHEFDILDQSTHVSECWSVESDYLKTPICQRQVVVAVAADPLDDTPSKTPLQSLDNSKDDLLASAHGSPLRRSQRISSLHNVSQTTDLRKYTLRKRSLSTADASATADPLLLKEQLSKLAKAKTEVLRKNRSNSNTKTQPSRRSKRGASVDAVIPQKKSPPETSILDFSTKNKTRKSKSVIDNKIANDYSNTRRLTRRQANLLRKKLDATSVELKENGSDDSCNSSSRGPDIAKMDAIQLLDKKSFEGDPDPDEELVQYSPVSSISESPVGSRLRSKSSLSLNTSPVSETSPTPSETSRRKVKRKILTEPEPRKSLSPNTPTSRKLRKTRLNSKDTDLSESSTISQAHSVVNIKKPGRISRRSKSLTNEIEQPSLRRSERNKLSKSILPKIIEEHGEVAHNAKPRKSKK